MDAIRKQFLAVALRELAKGGDTAQIKHVLFARKVGTFAERREITDPIEALESRQEPRFPAWVDKDSREKITRLVQGRPGIKRKRKLFKALLVLLVLGGIAGYLFYFRA